MTEVPDPPRARELGMSALQAAAEQRHDMAVALWEDALRLDPRNTDNAIEFTNFLAFRADRARDAVEVCSRLLAAHADLDILRVQKAIILYNRLSDRDGAIDQLKAHIARQPTDKFAHKILAQLYRWDLDFENARRHGRAALTGVDFREDLSIHGPILGDHEAAAEAASRLIATEPGNIEFLIEYCRCLRMSGRLERAISAAGRAADHAPNRFEATYHFGELLLLAGDLSAGWRRLNASMLEYHLTYNGVPARFRDRYWRGQDPQGRRILIVHFGGVGDSLMFSRYATRLRDLGADVTFVTPDATHRLFSCQVGFTGVDMSLDGTVSDAFDYWVIGIALPFFLNDLDLSHHVARVPYIAPPEETRAVWGERLKAHGPGLRVGLCWSSGHNYLYGDERGVPIAALAPLSTLEGVRWFVCQKHDRNREIENVFQRPVFNYADEWTDFADTAGFLSHLDLLISVDSAPLHLAGAMGAPVWGLMHFAAEWRWGVSGMESPWYPTLKLFRQPRPQAWDDVIQVVRTALSDLMPRGDSMPARTL